MPLSRLPEHKNADFVLEMPENGGAEGKAHKNLDFVLEKPENEGSEGKKRTKMPILCSGGEPTSRVKWHLSAT